MKTSDSVLHLPGNFLSACAMFNIQPVTALQFFISYMTVYFYLAKPFDKTMHLASKIIDSFLSSTKKRDKQDDYKQIINIGYVRKVFKLIMNEEDQDKERKYNALINQWYEEIKSKLPANTISTSNGATLSLTNDFCILCYILQLSPVNVLLHYIHHVSIPAYLKSAEENTYVYATAFFMHYPAIARQINAR